MKKNMEATAAAAVGQNLPTTVIGLVAFIALANISGMIWMLRYFLTAQRKQTETYMNYIQTKNGHLEKARDSFGEMLSEQSERHNKILSEQSDRHEKVLNAAMEQLRACQLQHA